MSRAISGRRQTSLAGGEGTAGRLFQLCVLAGALFFADFSHAQPSGTTFDPNLGGSLIGAPSSDPYQMVAPAVGSPSSAVLPAAGGLFAGRPAVDSRSPGGSDPYAIGPTTVAQAVSPAAAQLNAPLLNGPLLNGPLFQGGPIDNSLRQWDPLLPGFQNRIDSRLFLRAESLLWDVSGMDAPPLVTTSPDGTGQDIAATLGQAGTSVAFGGKTLNDGSTGGFLIGGGLWISPERNFAIETEYFQLSEFDDGYNGSSDGAVILGRPYFDVTQGGEAAELIAYPGLVSGDVGVRTESNLRSFLIDGRVSLCPTHGACCQQCGLRDRTDWIIGYRNIRLRDSLSIVENRRRELSNDPRMFASSDQFQTTNQFNGLQLGIVHRMLLQRAWLETSMRVALGNTEQTLRVAGSTTIEDQGTSATYDAGLLAQHTNSGTRSRDEFALVPELGVRLGIRLTDRLHANIGYSVLYLPNVIRASEQIDRDLNPGLVPPGTDPLAGALRPRVLWVQSDYLAHGLHLGGELNF
ncbi:BBP7 family outer membrane beta-barrel protein [Stieleria neptunia]|uniref:BBP7 family outer membrane beta-barrel protein n=1 Tax=Stieleria neptunia TaxID=2527979 RepID=UPI0011A79EB4|nr:BBP7 family outer membrane beta-barrel protein [Stieleria neptunia]